MKHKELFGVIMTKYGDVLAHVPGTRVPVYTPSGILEKLAMMLDEPFDLDGNYLDYDGWQKKKELAKTITVAAERARKQELKRKRGAMKE